MTEFEIIPKSPAEQVYWKLFRIYNLKLYRKLKDVLMEEFLYV